jgi:CDGSH-type Zn-finger protein
MNDEQPLPSREEEPQAAIVVCPDGPLLIRGAFEIVSSAGEVLPRQRRTVALCRCGATGIKPYCDGSHKLIGFRTEFAEPQADAAELP